MILRFFPVVMTEYFCKKYSMDAEQMGFLAAIFYLGYGFMQIPAGILLDRFNPRYVIPSFLIICILGILVTLTTKNIFFVYLGRFLMGAGSVGGFLGAVKAIDDFFPSKYTLFVGITIFLGILGTYIGHQPMTNFIQKTSHEISMIIMIIFGILIAGGILCFYNKKHNSNNISQIDIFKALKICYTNKKLWILGFLGGSMIGSVGCFADMWGEKYYIHAKDISPENASFAMSLAFVGLGIGSPIIGYLGQKYKRQGSMIFYMGILLIFNMLIIFDTSQGHTKKLYILSLSMGILSCYQVLLFSIANKLIKNNMVSMVTSIINMMLTSFIVFFHLIIGKILKEFFEPEIGINLKYSPKAYHSAFSIIIIFLLIGTIGFFKYNFDKIKAKKIK